MMTRSKSSQQPYCTNL